MALSEAEHTRASAQAEELARVHARIAGRFARPEVQERVGLYLAGLLGPVERRTGWQMAEQIGELRPDGVQRLLNKASWDVDLVRDDLRNYVIDHIGGPDGALVVCEAGFPKKGTKSIGVARQYNPSTGRVENCQLGVFLAYASSRGRAFIDRALYLPKGWAQDEGRRQETGVPEEVGYATKGELARAMLERAFEAEVPVGAWVLGDDVYRKDERFQSWLRSQGRVYVVQMKPSHELFERAKGEVGLDQYEVRRWEAWHRHVTLCLLAHAALQVTRASARQS